MKKISKKLSPAELSGIILLLFAAAVFFISPLLSAAIAFLYILLCLLGCFFPQTNFLLTVISHGNTGKNFVALTFDDGPSEPTTRQVLNLLDKYSMKATFFISGVNALRHPDIIKHIIDRGHTVGNHSYSHNTLLMLKSYRSLYREIADTKNVLQKMGINTFAFRPPVGIINPKLHMVLNKLDMFCLIFNCRAYDAGNFFVKNISKKILGKIKADDIILLHDVPARTEQDSKTFLSEVENILVGIGAKDLKTVPLSVLLNKEIMERTNQL